MSLGELRSIKIRFGPELAAELQVASRLAGPPSGDPHDGGASCGFKLVYGDQRGRSEPAATAQCGTWARGPGPLAGPSPEVNGTAVDLPAHSESGLESASGPIGPLRPRNQRNHPACERLLVISLRLESATVAA